MKWQRGSLYPPAPPLERTALRARGSASQFTHSSLEYDRVERHSRTCTRRLRQLAEWNAHALESIA